jgi:hypothetical protein
MILVLLIAAAISWHFSDQVLVPDHSNWSPQVQVEALPPGRIVLERTEDTERPGVYALEWAGGRAGVGAVVGGNDETVTRRLRTRRGRTSSQCISRSLLRLSRGRRARAGPR